mgnify:CR=1 FL=1
MDYLITKSPEKSSFVTKIRYLIPVLITAVGLLLASCGGDNSTGPGEDPPPEEEPNRLVSYSEDIQPIFNGNCTSSGCHNSNSQQSGVNLSSYDAALASTGNQYSEKVINPGNPDESPLVDKIEENPEFGDRMPYNSSALFQADIDSIRAWIEDGAPDN